MENALITILVSIVSGFVGGFIAALVFQKSPPLRAIFKPAQVEKRGPSLFVTETKRKPKALSEKDLWERENGIQGIKD